MQQLLSDTTNQKSDKPVHGQVILGAREHFIIIIIFNKIYMLHKDLFLFL